MTTTQRTPTQKLEDAAAAYLRKCQAAGNNRNDTIFSIAGHLRAFTTETGERLSEQAIRDLLRDYNVGLPDPLPDHEVVSAVGSAFRGNGTPRPDKVIDTKRAPARAKKAEKSVDAVSRLITRCAADVETCSVNWLWDKRFVAGAINLLCGMPDCGKSLLTCDMGARVSNGTAWPPIQGVRADNTAGSVAFLSMEDSPETTIVPRLKAAGADLNKIHIVEAVERVDVEAKTKFRDGFDISRDVHELETLRAHLGDLRLVVIDPLDSYLNAKLDTAIGNKVRAALWPLKDWAEASGVTILIVHHFNKTASTNAIDKVSGARSFGALPRSVWAAGRDDDHDCTVLVPIKLNLVRQDEKVAIGYTMRSSLANLDVPVIEWREEPIDVTASELLGAPRGGRLDEAADWLRDVLHDGPVDAKRMQELAEDAGQAWSTVKRAKSEAGVIVEQRRDGGKIVGWDWRLGR